MLFTSVHYLSPMRSTLVSYVCPVTSVLVVGFLEQKVAAFESLLYLPRSFANLVKVSRLACTVLLLASVWVGNKIICNQRFRAHTKKMMMD